MLHPTISSLVKIVIAGSILILATSVIVGITKVQNFAFTWSDGYVDLRYAGVEPTPSPTPWPTLTPALLPTSSIPINTPVLPTPTPLPLPPPTPNINYNVEVLTELVGMVNEAIFVQGDYAYVGSDSTLTIVDISTPDWWTKPFLVGQTPPLSEWVRNVYVSGNYAYVTAWSDVWIIDVSDPTQPVPVGSYNVNITAENIFVTNTTAYVSTGEAGLWILDVSNPAAPTELAVYYGVETTGAWDAYVNHNTAYVAAGSSLRMVDVSDAGNVLVECGSFNTFAETTDVFIHNNVAFLAGEAGMWLVDMSYPTRPEALSFYPLTGPINDIYVDGTMAYLADDTGLHIVNVSQPAYPVEAGFYSLPEGAWDVHVTGDNIYIAAGIGGMVILRYTGPAGNA